MKQSRSEKNYTMFVQTTLKMRKEVNSPLQTQAGAVVYDMKEKGIVDRSKPTASSTLQEERSTAMGKLVKSMSLFCSIYDVEFQSLVGDHEPFLKKDLSGKVDIVMADPLYTLRRDRKDGPSEDDVFGLDDMKDMAKVREDVIKPATHGHLFCSALQFALQYRAPASQKRET